MVFNESTIVTTSKDLAAALVLCELHLRKEEQLR